MTLPTAFELVFVHGTWARSGKYGQEGTYFVNKLMEFAGPGSGYFRFPWSGRNTVSAREQAVMEFKAFVANLPEKSSNKKRIAVCHSHGGSVVLMAFLDKATAATFDAVVCIGTPFLHVYRLSEVEPSVRPPLHPLRAIASLLALILFVWMGFGDPNLGARTFQTLSSVSAETFNWVVNNPGYFFFELAITLPILLIVSFILIGTLWFVKTYVEWEIWEKPIHNLVVKPISTSIKWSAPFLLWWLCFGEMNLFVRTLHTVLVTIDVALTWAGNHPILASLSIAALFFVALLVYGACFFLFLPYAEFRDNVRHTIYHTPRDAAWKIKERCRLPLSPPIPTFLLRAPADETYGALIFSRVVSFLVLRIYGFISLSLSRIEDRLRAWRLIGSLIGGLFGSASFFLRCVLSIPVSLIAGGALFLFGREFLTVGGHILISAESTPPGSWQVTVIPPVDRNERRLEKSDEFAYADDNDQWNAFDELEDGVMKEWEAATQGIIHSRGYTDPRAIALITNWLGRLV